MKIFPGKLTDDEYVERIRGYQKINKVWAITFFIINLVLLTAMFFTFVPLFDSSGTVHSLIFGNAEDRPGFYIGMGIGFVFFCLVNSLAFSFAICFILYRQPRIQRLLLKYYDMNKN